jgi:hypothetical protein
MHVKLEPRKLTAKEIRAIRKKPSGLNQDSKKVVLETFQEFARPHPLQVQGLRRECWGPLLAQGCLGKWFSMFRPPDTERLLRSGNM